MFSTHVNIKEPNEVEVLTILEALQIFFRSFTNFLVVKSDSSNALSWASLKNKGLWRFRFHFNEIKDLAASLHVHFRHVCGSADVFSKQKISISFYFDTLII